MPVQQHNAGALFYRYILLNICITICQAVRIQIGLVADKENASPLGGTFADFGDEREGKVFGNSSHISGTPINFGTGMGDAHGLKKQGLTELVPDVSVIAPVGIGW